jgi:hypothetical protein
VVEGKAEIEENAVESGKPEPTGDFREIYEIVMKQADIFDVRRQNRFGVPDCIRVLIDADEPSFGENFTENRARVPGPPERAVGIYLSPASARGTRAPLRS